MNILFTCSARKWGGNEAWVLNAVQVLKERHNVVLAYRRPEVGDRFQIPKYSLPFRHEADLQTLMQLVSIIRKNRIDVVVPTKRKDYVLAGLACRLTGAKNVMILGIVRDLKDSALNNLVYNRLADGIMVNAKMIRDVLLQAPYMKPEKIAVIPNSIAIDAAAVKPAPKPFGFTIASLAELSERKGFDFLIRGFARFVREHAVTNAGLLIMGSGGELERLKALSKELGVERMVIFAGFVKDPYPALASSDVFALTSKNEGIPYATIEACLLHNAVITTKAGGVEELLRDNEHCLTIDYGDEQALADRIFRLYNDPGLRQRLAENACATVSAQFSLEKMEAGMVGFFRQVLGKAPQRSNRSNR